MMNMHDFHEGACVHCGVDLSFWASSCEGGWGFFPPSEKK